MEYEIVNLREKKIIGITARTNNMSSDMPVIIGGLWDKFFRGGVYNSIENKTNYKAIGAYSDYASDASGDYTVTIGSEVEKVENIPEGAVEKIIPEGKYAKFIVVGHQVKAVQEFWEKLWKMDIDRSYKCDFEEYQNESMENAIIHVYISIK
ncbi:MAG TPA: AraC family transcriptional regulator [Clostridium sp.]|nr:AraC family transcriptional regulator [Clostridium sp.]